MTGRVRRLGWMRLDRPVLRELVDHGGNDEIERGQKGGCRRSCDVSANRKGSGSGVVRFKAIGILSIRTHGKMPNLPS